MRTVGTLLLLMVLSVRTTSSQDFMTPDVNIFSEMSKITTNSEQIKMINEEIKQLRREKQEQQQTLEALRRSLANANARIDELLPKIKASPEPGLIKSLQSQLALMEKAATFHAYFYVAPKFYVSDKHLMTYDDGQKWCQDAGGRLAMPKNYMENQMLVKVLQKVGSDYILMGANDRVTEDRWVDTKGAKMEYSSWHSGEPNNYGGNEDCIILSDDGLWHDISCEKRYLIACELD